ncbi:unnamed protein product [Gordionus sp. m RMFG-2023]
MRSDPYSSKSNGLAERVTMNTYYVNLKSSILQINEAQAGTALACAWTELANRKEELIKESVQQLFNRPIFRLTCFACGTDGHKAANCPSNTYVINNNDNNQNKDYEGQLLAEKIYQSIIIIFGVLGFLLGYYFQLFSYTVYLLGIGILISSLMVIPAWPIYRQKPLKWQKLKDN